jgi:hypothetical protein
MLDGAAASVVAATQSIVVVKVVVMKVLVLGALAPVGEELLWLIVAQLALLFVARFALVPVEGVHFLDEDVLTRLQWEPRFLPRNLAAYLLRFWSIGVGLGNEVCVASLTNARGLE